MRVILHSSVTDTVVTGLKTEIGCQLPGLLIETTPSLAELTCRLCRPLSGISVVIIHVRSVEELELLTVLTDILDAIRLVLILPDRSSSTTALSLRLNPSFISYPDTCLFDVIAVLQKLNQKEARRGPRYAEATVISRFQ